MGAVVGRQAGGWARTHRDRLHARPNHGPSAAPEVVHGLGLELVRRRRLVAAEHPAEGGAVLQVDLRLDAGFVGGGLRLPVLQGAAERHRDLPAGAAAALGEPAQAARAGPERLVRLRRVEQGAVHEIHAGELDHGALALRRARAVVSKLVLGAGAHRAWRARTSSASSGSAPAVRSTLCTASLRERRRTGSCCTYMPVSVTLPQTFTLLGSCAPRSSVKRDPAVHGLGWEGRGKGHRPWGQGRGWERSPGRR